MFLAAAWPGAAGQPGALRRQQAVWPCPAVVLLLSGLRLARRRSRARRQQGGAAGGRWAGGGAGLTLSCLVSWRPRVSTGQCGASKCLTASSLQKQKQNLICLVCQFLWHKHSCQRLFQAAERHHGPGSWEETRTLGFCRRSPFQLPAGGAPPSPVQGPKHNSGPS